LVGAARAAQSSQDKATALASQQNTLRRRRILERKHTAVERQIELLRSGYQAEEQEARRADNQDALRTRVVSADRTELAFMRPADAQKSVKERPNSNSKKKRL